MPKVPKLPWPKLQTWPDEVRAREWPAPAATLTKWCSLVPLMKRGCGCSTPTSPSPVESIRVEKIKPPHSVY